ncbi:transcriptional regulator GcvA [Roseovarius rhodophyticola]|uniref:Transcriptional regulator GcvA n=1 Tax=Roseovarius rhodophyticola TaxID=3080827 RepID=A0ABZ2TF66_9RHOB|nr:transcriptional regulator GcvA [Roseovarius sp. W115]MDV2930453.1 transcriptional regulator GcvA [Roseovarius sp. W115]
MSDRLPPLTALRAFDAAARHMSFQKAADELSVTPAALSFQIKSLEQHLGAPLFRRLNRAVALTEAGETLAPGCRDGFTSLVAAWTATRRLQDVSSLTVTAGPGFTSKWLAPRLFEFAQAHPEIELRFAASLKAMDFDRDQVDVAIRFGYGPDTDVWSLPLAEEWVTPVMTPTLATQFPTPESLRDAVLIVDQSIDFLDPSPTWANWFRSVGVDPIEAHGPRFSQTDHAVDAALAGVGVTLGRRALVIKDLMDGRLVAPYKVALSTGARFRFLCRKGSEDKPQIKAFRDWMLAEIDKGRPSSDQMKILPLPSE